MADEAADPIDVLFAMLVEAATALTLSVEERRDLIRPYFRGAEGAEVGAINASDLPTRTRAMKIDRCALLIGALPDDPTPQSVKETVRRYRNQCVVARSYLTPNEALDLQLFLVGPRSSERIDEWRPLALATERDDRVARKLIWLRPASPDLDAVSFQDFVRRSFLAQPWVHDGALFSAAPLDSLTRLTGLDDEKSPRDMIDEWVELASSKKDADSMVAGLVAAWQKRGAA